MDRHFIDLPFDTQMVKIEAFIRMLHIENQIYMKTGSISRSLTSTDHVPLAVTLKTSCFSVLWVNFSSQQNKTSGHFC